MTEGKDPQPSDVQEDISKQHLSAEESEVLRHEISKLAETHLTLKGTDVSVLTKRDLLLFRRMRDAYEGRLERTDAPDFFKNSEARKKFFEGFNFEDFERRAQELFHEPRDNPVAQSRKKLYDFLAHHLTPITLREKGIRIDRGYFGGTDD